MLKKELEKWYPTSEQCSSQKTMGQFHQRLPSYYCQRGHRGTQNNTSHCYYFWLPIITGWQVLKTHIFWLQDIEKNQFWTDKIALSPLASFHSARRSRLLRDKEHEWSYSALDLACYNTDLPGKMFTGVIMAMLFIGRTNHSLGWIWALLYRREFMPNSTSLVKPHD